MINADDIIMLHGGGNMGDEYIQEEELRRLVISTFKEQKVISFPQTIYFKDTEYGQREFEKTKQIYRSHPNLTVIAREKISYRIMKEAFPNNNVILTPDIVLYLNESSNSEKRDYIMCCFRHDQEKVISDHFKKSIYDQLSKDYKVIVTDTIVPYTVKVEDRIRELNRIWSDYKKAKLVITDRLHGMVFGAITSTPTIALTNYNHKVKGTFEWIKDLPYVKFVEEEDEVFHHINSLLQVENRNYDNTSLRKYYKQIIDIIKS